MLEYKQMNEDSIGGLFLILGSLVLLTTIYFEYNIGWIGNSRTEKETIEFLIVEWENLKHIWFWQLLSHFIFTIAYFLLLKRANILMQIIWFILLVCSLLLLVAFGLTLGAYYPALETYSSEPKIFETTKGGIGYLYRFGRYGLLLLLVAFFVETVDKNGKIRKVFGLTLFAFVILIIFIGYSLGISIKIVGVSFIFLPLAIGYFYLNSDTK